MKSKTKIKQLKRERRKVAIRQRVHGSAEKPRVFVHRTNKYLYVGAANDDNHEVLCSAFDKKGVKNAKKLGEKFGKLLSKKDVKSVVFDRSGYKYHGQVKALADAIRESGINF